MKHSHGDSTALVNGKKNRSPKISNKSYYKTKPLDGIKILVVDDTPDVLTLIGSIFRYSGAEVFTAMGAMEAFRLFKNFEPDVIVSDICMPDHDGYDLVRWIREYENTLDFNMTTPAVAITAYSHQESAQKAYDAGFQSFFLKPVVPKKLVSIIEELAC